MARLFLNVAATVSLLLCAVCLAFCAYTQVAADLNHPFMHRGERWELAVRGGVLAIGNQPQLDWDLNRYVPDEDPLWQEWHAEHLRLMTTMEHARYGPKYDAAVAKVDAWEKVNGIRYTWVPPTTLTEYRVPLPLLIVLLALPPIGLILFRRSRDDKQNAPCPPIVSVALSCVVIVITGATWLWSYHRPITFPFYGEYVAYTVDIRNGGVVIGYPLVSNSSWLRHEARFARQLHNDDVQWVLLPPIQALRPGAHAPGNDLVLARLTSNVAGKWDTTEHHNESIAVLLRAMHDPDQYLAAYIMLADILYGRSGTRGQVSDRGIPFPIGRSILQLATPPEAPASRDILLRTSPVIPGQLAKVAALRHQQLDARSRRFPIWPALLLPTPLAGYWLMLYRKRRRWRWKTHCRTCDYDLTGNTTGICSECGTKLTPAAPS